MPDFHFHFEPRTPSQKEAVRAFQDHPLVFLLGPAATGKSFVALALALREVHQGRAKRVVYSRPLVESGEKVGFLPGGVEDKVLPFRASADHILGKLCPKFPQRLFEFVPLAHMRGSTFDEAVMVLSEAQNVSYPQLKMFLTRAGVGTKVLVEGDPEQSDLPSDGDELLRAVERLEGKPGVWVVDFDGTLTLRGPVAATASRWL